MNGQAMAYLGGKSQIDRAGFRVARELRGLGMSAKEIARLVLWRTKYPIEVKTIQNAMAGSVSLDTYDLLVGTFGWDFSRNVMAPRVGKTPLEALEEEISFDRSQLAAREAQFQRRLEAERARSASLGGVLRLVAPEEDEPGLREMGRSPDMG